MKKITLLFGALGFFYSYQVSTLLAGRTKGGAKAALFKLKSPRKSVQAKLKEAQEDRRAHITEWLEKSREKLTRFIASEETTLTPETIAFVATIEKQAIQYFTTKDLLHKEYTSLTALLRKAKEKIGTSCIQTMGNVLTAVGEGSIDDQEITKAKQEAQDAAHQGLVIPQNTTPPNVETSYLDQLMAWTIDALGDQDPNYNAALTMLKEKGYLQALITCAPHNLRALSLNIIAAVTVSYVPMIEYVIPTIMLVAAFRIVITTSWSTGVAMVTHNPRILLNSLYKDFLETSARLIGGNFYEKSIAIGRSIASIGRLYLGNYIGSYVAPLLSYLSYKTVVSYLPFYAGRTAASGVTIAAQAVDTVAAATLGMPISDIIPEQIATGAATINQGAHDVAVKGLGVANRLKEWRAAAFARLRGQ